MISPRAFYEALLDSGVNFVTGVPDSLLKEFCAFADAALPAERHLIAANEGTAVGIAAGVQLATGGVPLVYLQNSGLGNTVNPLLSLADPEVYGIPMVLLIGWRGEPGVQDEPQHVKQGRVSPELLKAMEIPCEILDGNPEVADRIARAAVEQALQRSGPVAILVRKGAFDKAEERRDPAPRGEDLLSREKAVEIVTSTLPKDATVVSTTGHISRELYEQRVRMGQDRSSDFLTVGCMGHASQIALGIALTSGHPVVCLDGDGAALMHMGGLATIGTSGADNYLHVVLNNGVHGSVGGQPTVAMDINLTEVARACGYRAVRGPISGGNEIRSAIAGMLEEGGPAFVEIRVQPGARADLGRPRETPTENKRMFVERLRSPSHG